MDRHTPVNLLPCPKLRLRAVINEHRSLRPCNVFHFHRVAKEDEGKTIECVVVSANGTTVSNGQIVNPGCKSLIHCSLVVKIHLQLQSY